MDIRIAAESARFGFVFARVGIVPEAASSWFLPRVVGISQAMEWVATGRVFDAAGGATRAAGLPGRAGRRSAAHRLRARPGDRGEHQWRRGGSGPGNCCGRCCRGAVRRGTRTGPSRGRWSSWGRAPISAEGVAAFLEKRKPVRSPLPAGGRRAPLAACRRTTSRSDPERGATADLPRVTPRPGPAGSAARGSRPLHRPRAHRARVRPCPARAQDGAERAADRGPHDTGSCDHRTPPDHGRAGPDPGGTTGSPRLAAEAIWNADIRRQPAAIVRPTSAEEVARAVTAIRAGEWI